MNNLKTECSARIERHNQIHDNSNKPYIKLDDEIVLEKLKAIAKININLLAINQNAAKVLVRNEDGLFEAWSYTAHIPDDIDTYFFHGLTTDFMHDIKRLFSSEFQFSDEDKSRYCDKSY